MLFHLPLPLPVGEALELAAATGERMISCSPVSFNDIKHLARSMPADGLEAQDVVPPRCGCWVAHIAIFVAAIGFWAKHTRSRATGNFTGVFVSGPAATCPGVPYDLAGRVRGSRVVFRTARDWTPDLQSDHGLVWTLCQPDDRCHKRYRHIRCAKRPRGKGARHGSFPAHLNLGAMRQISRSAGSG